MFLPFPKAVHQRLKMHPRNVNKAIARANIAPGLRAALSGHPAADNGGVLDLLVRMSPLQQDALAGALTLAWSVGELRRRVNALLGKSEPRRRDHAALIIALWDKATGDERKRVRDFIPPRTGRGEG